MKILDALIHERSLDLPPSLDWLASYSFNGNTYTLPVQTTMPGQKTETIANDFTGFAQGGLFANGVIFGLEMTRVRVFSQARLMFQKLTKGRPGDLWSDASLDILQHPWPGGTTSDLLATALLHADIGGNAYGTIIDGQIVLLRPDWVDIVLGKRYYRGGTVGLEKAGYNYYQGGRGSGVDPVPFGPDEVFHFAPHLDPTANFRGMSWMSPIVREIQSDSAFTGYKLKFTENAATPNLAVSLKEITDPDQFTAFVDKMDDSHKGWQNAYKTLYLGAGADVTVIGSNLNDLDFKAVQGAGETRLAQAAGVPPVVAGLSEGLQGSSLNAGNFGQAKRQFAEQTLAHLWDNFTASLEVVIPVQSGSRLTYDTRDMPFLREDQKDEAEILQLKSQAIRELFMAGFTPESAVNAVVAGDHSLLQHTGLFSIQTQEPGAGNPKLPGPSVDGGNSENPATPGQKEKPVTVATPKGGVPPQP